MPCPTNQRVPWETSTPHARVLLCSVACHVVIIRFKNSAVQHHQRRKPLSQHQVGCPNHEMVRHSNGHERRRTEISFGVEFHEWSWKAGLVLFLMLFVPGVLAWGASQSSQQRILLSNVDTITVYADRNTAYRRTVLFFL